MKKICYLFLLLFLTLMLGSCSDELTPSNTDPLPWNYEKDMDKTILPGDDFYAYALGQWLKTTTLPSGMPITGINEEAYIMQYKNVINLINTSNDPVISKLRQDIGNNELTERNSINALKKHLQIVTDIRSDDEFIRGLGSILSLGYKSFFTLQVVPFKGFVAMLNTGFSYYLSLENYKNADLRERYKEWLIYCFTALGYPQNDAYRKAENVISIEMAIVESTNLASQSYKYWNVAENFSHLKKLPQVKTRGVSPVFNFLVESMGLNPENTYVYNRTEPILDMISSVDIEKLKDYMENCIIQANIHALPIAFRQKVANIFNDDIIPENTLLQLVARQYLPYYLSRLYSETYFNSAVKDQATKMARELQSAFRQRIEGLDWMSGTTKNKAIAKLEAMKFKIGYPDTWNDQATPNLSGDCFCADLMQCRELSYKFNVNITKQQFSQEAIWDYFVSDSPLYEVNAYYFRAINAMYIPAGTLLPPLYDLSVSDAFNYATIAATTIGHEITHGFDDGGSQFNQDGVREDWWTLADKMEFKKKQDEFIQCFNSLEAWDGLPANGAKTLGENIADLGGLEMAHLAFMQKKVEEGFNGTVLDEQEKKFYLSYAQAWRSIYTEKHAFEMTQQDVHSLPKLRVNGIVIHSDAWYRAFGVKWGEKLYLPEDFRIHIW